MKVAFYTLGCKVNQYETNVLLEQFVRAGFEIVEPEEYAEIYVINSCTVTAGADSKTRQMLRRFRRQNPLAVIALCGCFPQAFPAIAGELPEADILMGSSNRKGLLDAVRKFMAEGEPIVDITPHEKGDEFEPMQVSAFTAHTRAFVKIQDGCERFCSYCIIPFARGSVRSKSLEDIKVELTNLAQAGYKEVVLVGINLSSYGQDTGKRLLDAIQVACGVEGIARVRLGSLEPELLSEEDIKAMAGLEKLCPQFHLSLQSGSDTVLERMRRPYNLADYRRIVTDLRGAFSNASITTDIMVGFPEETLAEHEESLAFVREIGLARAHVFAYSSRPGTRAAKLKDHVPNKEKARRSREMLQATNETRELFLQSQIGLIEEVLFEAKTKADYCEGYSKNYTSVIIKSKENLAGSIKKVRLTGIKGDACTGELYDNN